VGFGCSTRILLLHRGSHIFLLCTRSLSRLCFGGADSEEGLFAPGRLPQDYPMKIVWKKGFIRLVLVAGILWMLLILIALVFHIWSCQSSVSFFSGICGKMLIFAWYFVLVTFCFCYKFLTCTQFGSCGNGRR
jgi:hypothetical protein